MGLEAIGDGLKVRIQTISSIKHVFAPKELPNSVNEFPSALILPGEVNFTQTLGDVSSITLRVLLLMSKQDTPSALNKLLDYINPSGSDSIYAAINGDPTLGSICDFAWVTTCSGAGSTTWGAYIYLSTQFEVKCIQ